MFSDDYGANVVGHDIILSQGTVTCVFQYMWGNSDVDLGSPSGNSYSLEILKSGQPYIQRTGEIEYTYTEPVFGHPWLIYYGVLTIQFGADIPSDLPPSEGLPDLIAPTGPRGHCDDCPPVKEAKPQSKTEDPVRYADGALEMWENDLDASSSEGLPWRRSYSNLIGHADSEMGPSWTTSSQPRILRKDAAYVIRLHADKQVAFTQQPGAVFNPIRSGRETLVQKSTGDLVFANPAGETLVFHGFDNSLPVRQQGRLKRVYTAGGAPTTMLYDANGVALEQRRSTGINSADEMLAFTYDATTGLLTNVQRQQVLGGAPTVLQQATYSYDPTVGQLRSATIANGTGQILRRFHYRYYTGAETGGFVGLLKLAIGPRNHERALAAGIDPATATDAQLAPFADKAFQYDASRRVTQQVLRTPDVDGSGTFSYNYIPRATPPATPGPNDWLMRFVETQPDGSINTAFTNQAGDVLFKQTATSAGVVVRADAYRYNADWRVTWHITPAALQPVAGAWFDAAHTDLLNFASGNSPYVKDGAGLIERWTYYATTGSGAATGYIQHEQTQQGELGAPTLIKTYSYTGSP